MEEMSPNSHSFTESIPPGDELDYFYYKIRRLNKILNHQDFQEKEFYFLSLKSEKVVQVYIIQRKSFCFLVIFLVLYHHCALEAVGVKTVRGIKSVTQHNFLSCLDFKLYHHTEFKIFSTYVFNPFPGPDPTCTQV